MLLSDRYYPYLRYTKSLEIPESTDIHWIAQLNHSTNSAQNPMLIRKVKPGRIVLVRNLCGDAATMVCIGIKNADCNCVRTPLLCCLFYEPGASFHKLCSGSASGFRLFSSTPFVLRSRQLRQQGVHQSDLATP